MLRLDPAKFMKSLFEPRPKLSQLEDQLALSKCIKTPIRRTRSDGCALQPRAMSPNPQTAPANYHEPAPLFAA